MHELCVIVPVYKVEKSIKRCLKSILQQSFTDFSLMLIDDGSPDTSGILCDEVLLEDERTISIHATNKGLSAARNRGIDWAFLFCHIKWISFVDSDDCIKIDFLEKLYYANIEKGTQISLCRFNQCPSINENCLISTRKNSSRQDALLCTSQNAYQRVNFGSQAWARIYSKQLFSNGQRFPVGKVYEDQWLIPRLSFSVPNTAFVDEELYYYLYNPDGITSVYKLSSLIDLWDAYEDNILFYTTIQEENMIKITTENLLRGLIIEYKKIKHKKHSKKYEFLYIKQRTYKTVDKYKGYISNDRIEETKAVLSLFYRIRKKLLFKFK